MHLSDCIKESYSFFVSPLAVAWAPCEKLPPGHRKLYHRDFVRVPLKCCARTLTIGAGAAITALVFSILSKTTLGQIVGISVFVSTATLLPPTLLFLATVVGVIATGILTSYLIEKFV